MTDFTLTYLMVRDQGGSSVHLARKRQKINAGKLTGSGGKMKPGESILGCALREDEEELGLGLCEAAYSLRSVLYVKRPEGEARVFVFVAMLEVEKIIPAGKDFESGNWYSLPKLPFMEMPEGDTCWLLRTLLKKCDEGPDRVELDFVSGPLIEGIRYPLVHVVANAENWDIHTLFEQEGDTIDDRAL